MGCGASAPAEEVGGGGAASLDSSRLSVSNVQPFEGSNEVSEADIKPRENPIDWEWKSASISTKSDSERDIFSSDEVFSFKTPTRSSRHGCDHMEPIIELEDFEENDYRRKSEDRVSTCDDQASLQPTPRI